MIRRPTSFMLASLLLCVLCLASASANTPANAASKSDGAGSQPASRADGGDKKEVNRGEKLKADVSKMITDAREGRGRDAKPPRQQQPAQSNSLSPRQKVLIGVAITVGVLAIIYFSVFAGKHL